MRSLRSLSVSALYALLLLTSANALAASTSVPASIAMVSKDVQTAPLSVDPLKRPTPLEIMIDKSVPVNLTEPAATVFVANPEIADIQVLSPNSVMVFGKKAGQTTLIIAGNDGKNLVYHTVMVSQNLADLRDAIRTVVPGSSIQVEPIPNGIVLTGDVGDSTAIEDIRRLAARYLPETGGDIINRIRVRANNQIQIRVRFAEVSKDVDKRFGIDWETVGTVGSFAFGLATGADFITAGSTAITRTVVGDSVNDAFSTSFNNNHFSVNGMIDALAKDGFVTILAEPSLTAMSGETASFLAGGEFPIPVPQSANTITIEWKQYGVSLAFTPTILNENRINLHVRPEVSQLSDAGSVTLNNINIPALTTRRAETTIELNSGQSFAIAGLLNNQQTQSVDKFPFLGDVPVLGPLFRSTRFQNNESELVIIITPYIVKPTTQENLSLPTDGLAAPTDTDRVFRLRQTNSDPNAKTISGAPRAVRVENPIHAESPVVTKAPVAPVLREAAHGAERPKAADQSTIRGSRASTATTMEEKKSSSSTGATSALAPAPMSKPAPVKPKVKTPGPSGQGGFIVE